MRKIIVVIICFALAALFSSSIFFFVFWSIRPANNIKNEFDIQGLTWRTYSYFYNPKIYKQGYNFISNIRFLKKAQNVGGNFLLIRAFYNGNTNGDVIGDDKQAKLVLSKAIRKAHKAGFKILLTPYVESREYGQGDWVLSTSVWSDVVLNWAKFAQDNNIEMFTPGVEMNLIFNKNESADWLKQILPRIRKVYFGIITTAEHYDDNKWRILDDKNAFASYDCIGLTFFPRKEYDGVSDIRSFADYQDYIEKEASVIDKLSQKYDIACKIAVPLGLDYWKGSYNVTPVPSAKIIARAIPLGLDILKKHNFTGVFISHWASEKDHFYKDKSVETVLHNRWAY